MTSRGLAKVVIREMHIRPPRGPPPPPARVAQIEDGRYQVLAGRDSCGTARTRLVGGEGGAFCFGNPGGLSAYSPMYACFMSLYFHGSCSRNKRVHMSTQDVHKCSEQHSS